MVVLCSEMKFALLQARKKSAVVNEKCAILNHVLIGKILVEDFDAQGKHFFRSAWKTESECSVTCGEGEVVSSRLCENKCSPGSPAFFSKEIEKNLLSKYLDQLKSIKRKS